MEDTAGGNVRVRGWPRGRKKIRTKAERDLENAFREAMRTAKQWPPDMQGEYRAAVEGTALLPTDLIMTTIYGNAFAIRMQDGRTLYHMITRAKVSESLDVLSQTLGAVLIRGPTFWGELPPGTEGQILVIGPDDVPIWADPEAAGVFLQDHNNNAEGTGSGAYTDLASHGPEVSVVTDTTAIVDISAYIYKNGAGTGNNGYMSFAISGATTRAASDDWCVTASGMQSGGGLTCSRSFKVTGLTPGLNTFTAKYKVNGQNFGFWLRDLAVTPL